jgi:HSP20 family protein
MDGLKRYHNRGETNISPFEDMNRWFRNFFEDFPTVPWRISASQPAIDVIEADDKYTVKADLPGLTEKDINVSVDGNVLNISSTKEEKLDEAKEGYLLHERRRTGFQRSFTLPSDANPEQVQAEYKNGILTLNIPKTPGAKKKKIPVQAGT